MRQFRPILLLLGLLLWAGPAAARDGPVAYTARVAREVVRILAEDVPLAEKHRLLRQDMLRYVDLHGIARTLAGRAYARASAAERQAYEKQFTSYLYESYIRRARSYGGQKLALTGATRQKDGHIAVHSRLTLSKKTTLGVTWYLSEVANGYKLYDVRFAAFSLLTLKMGYFKSLMHRHPNQLAGLTEELAKQTARRKAANDRVLITQRPTVTVKPLAKSD